MALFISKNLNGIETLNKENVKVNKYNNKGIKRNIGILNLMPTKLETETQFLRLLNNCGEDINIYFLRLESIDETSSYYNYTLENYYTFNEVKEKLNGIIITGAPLEKIEFEEVSYIEELKYILDYVKDRNINSISICWGAQATLNYFYNIRKVIEEKKIFGIFSHEIIQEDPILKNIDNGFKAPHSRYTSLCKLDLECNKEVKVLAITEDGYDHLLKGKFNDYYILGHCEYDFKTLDNEYKRDLKKELDIDIPKNYYIKDDIRRGINYNWNSDSVKLYRNWINLIDSEGKAYEKC